LVDDLEKKLSKESESLSGIDELCKKKQGEIDELKEVRSRLEATVRRLEHQGEEATRYGESLTKKLAKEEDKGKGLEESLNFAVVGKLSEKWKEKVILLF